MPIDKFLFAVEENTVNYPELKFLETLRFDARWAQTFRQPFSYYAWLWSAVTLVKPKNLVELGTEFGAATIVMLDALPETSTLVTVDIVEMKPNFLYGLEDSRLTKIIGNSLEVSDQIPEKIDFLFIDTEHEFEQVSKEWKLYKSKLTKNAIVVFDDIHFNEGMTRFWDSLEEEKYDISQWHEAGFGVVFKK